MYKAKEASGGGGGSAAAAARKGDEVELVSKFLAPLCARDEAARNLALAAARTTVEGWLGGVGSPNNNWEPAKGCGNRCAESPLKANANYRLQQLQDSFDGFFPHSVSEGAARVFTRKTSFDANLTPERYPSGSFDCVDGRGNENYDSHENRFGSSSDSERRLFASNEGLNDEDKQQRPGRHYIRAKSGRQKQFDEDDELDVDTRMYGKSPKFDDNFGNMEFRSRKFRDDDFVESSPVEADRVVFNTIDGFLSESKRSDTSLEEKTVERKLSAGQIKRPLSQDEDVPWKSGRVIESPADVVTPGDVGRMLNLGNALDGPRQAQANKYLSLVSLHLPVILRLSVNCPFQNVRIKCAEIIQMIKDRGLPVPEPAFDGPSAFIPVSEVAPASASSFLRSNRTVFREERRTAPRQLSPEVSQPRDDADAAAGARLEAGAQGLGAAAAPRQRAPLAGLLPLRRGGAGVRARRGRGVRVRCRAERGRGQPPGHVRQLPRRPLRHRRPALAPHRWLIAHLHVPPPRDALPRAKLAPARSQPRVHRRAALFPFRRKPCSFDRREKRRVVKARKR